MVCVYVGGVCGHVCRWVFISMVMVGAHVWCGWVCMWEDVCVGVMGRFVCGWCWYLCV